MTEHEGRTFEQARAEINARDLSRYVTAGVDLTPERYALYRLCECASCDGTGKTQDAFPAGTSPRCQACRGEGRTRDLIATCGSAEAVGVALVTLAREGEWADGCPLGLLDTMGDKGERWLIKPWEPSTRNVTAAAKLLRGQQKERT